MGVAAMSYFFGILASHFIYTGKLSNKNIITSATGVKFSHIYGLESAKKQLS
jgi:hypothetical protein